MLNLFIAADDIEVGVGNKIPLWLFGFCINASSSR